MRIALLVALFALGPAGLGAAHADSDGYYCAGGGYLAYQFGLGPLPGAPHRLYLLRIGTTGGIAEPAAIELPVFQVHGLRCGAGWVDVAGFTAIYRVTLDESAKPAGYEMRPLAVGQQVPPEFFSQLNLGTLSLAGRDRRTVRVSLGTKERGGEYVLEMTARQIGSQACLASLTSRILETDANGREIRQLIIFQGRHERDCG